MQKKPLSYIELSKDNLIHNIKEFRKLVKDKTKIAGVVKANAYGHGDIEVVSILDSYVDYFQIDSIEELRRVRKITKKEIFIFGYVSSSEIEEAILLKCTLSVFDLEHAKKINKIAGKNKILQKVHLAVDSLLGREGVMPKDIEGFLKIFKKLKNLKLEGIYSHFANIEDTMNFSYAEKQINVYGASKEGVEALGKAFLDDFHSKRVKLKIPMRMIYNQNVEDRIREMNRLNYTEARHLSKKYDFAICFEVAEHIPKQFETTYLNNLIKHCKKGIVISWAIVGQKGIGHVNCQNNDYVKENNSYYRDRKRSRGSLFFCYKDGKSAVLDRCEIS